MCKMSLYRCVDGVICRENEKHITSDIFIYLLLEVTFMYISVHWLMFLLSDPSRHPSPRRGLQFASNFVLC